MLRQVERHFVSVGGSVGPYSKQQQKVDLRPGPAAKIQIQIQIQDDGHGQHALGHNRTYSTTLRMTKPGFLCVEKKTEGRS